MNSRPGSVETLMLAGSPQPLFVEHARTEMVYSVQGERSLHAAAAAFHCSTEQFFMSPCEPIAVTSKVMALNESGFPQETFMLLCETVPFVRPLGA